MKRKELIRKKLKQKYQSLIYRFSLSLQSFKLCPFCNQFCLPSLFLLFHYLKYLHHQQANIATAVSKKNKNLPKKPISRNLFGMGGVVNLS